MRKKFIFSEVIFWILMFALILVSGYLIVFGDITKLKIIFYKPIELGTALLSISIAATTTRLFTYFSSDNPLNKQKQIKFCMLSNLYMYLNYLVNKSNETEWEKTKAFCANCINNFYLNACEENVKESDILIDNFFNKFLNIKYRKSIVNIPTLLNDIENCIKIIDNKSIYNKSIYFNRFKRIRKLKQYNSNIDE